MKILFLYPNAGSQLGFNYGIAHLSAVLKQAGHDVALWQLCDDIEPLPSKEQFIARLRREAADIIGFSVVTNQWPYAKKLAAWAREATEVPLVCGGIHTMAAAEEILQSQTFDFIIRGEAEEPILLLHPLDIQRRVDGAPMGLVLFLNQFIPGFIALTADAVVSRVGPLIKVALGLYPPDHLLWH